MQLSDGSIWDTRQDNNTTARWLTTDMVDVIRQPCGNCAFQLRNLSTREVVMADIVAQPSCYSQGRGNLLQHNIEYGMKVTLDDFGFFIINPADVCKTRLWLPGETIERCSSSDYNYPFILKNVNRGESASAGLLPTNR